LNLRRIVLSCILPYSRIVEYKDIEKKTAKGTELAQKFGLFSHKRQKRSVVGGHHGECGARAYNGVLGAEPPARSRGRAPGQGVRGFAP